MNDRTLSLLGLIRRANRLSFGFDTVLKSIKENKAQLVLLASDLSQNSIKEIKLCADNAKIKVLETQYTMDDIDKAIGKHTGIICITDKGFSDKIISLLETE